MPICSLGGQYVCYEPEPCAEVGPDGETYTGLWNAIVVDGEVVGRTCITDAPGEPAVAPVVTPGMVVRAFRSLTWPASELTIQPPGGKTAVNFDTYYFTDNTTPRTQTVQLLGQQVTIEATPAQYTWHYGDGTTDTTTTPGGPYPTGDVIHQYLRKGQASPSLDTTYTGRYQVNGGPWHDIPDSLTVPGTPQQLAIIEVRPTLVGY
ncbi:hypothetical protein [Nocardioides sp. GXZ039]|uniref:hypothetical protein n=1 Tax=Nocardioides sp. GXZ039 TaxID=3136018 RepID=UPI0030F40228